MRKPSSKRSTIHACRRPHGEGHATGQPCKLRVDTLRPEPHWSRYGGRPGFQVTQNCAVPSVGTNVVRGRLPCRRHSPTTVAARTRLSGRQVSPSGSPAPGMSAALFVTRRLRDGGLSELPEAVRVLQPAASEPPAATESRVGVLPHIVPFTNPGRRQAIPSDRDDSPRSSDHD